MTKFLKIDRIDWDNPETNIKEVFVNVVDISEVLSYTHRGERAYDIVMRTGGVKHTTRDDVPALLSSITQVLP